MIKKVLTILIAILEMALIYIGSVTILASLWGDERIFFIAIVPALIPLWSLDDKTERKQK